MVRQIPTTHRPLRTIVLLENAQLPCSGQKQALSANIRNSPQHLIVREIANIDRLCRTVHVNAALQEIRDTQLSLLILAVDVT